MGTGTCHQSIDTSAKNAKKDGGMKENDGII